MDKAQFLIGGFAMFGCLLGCVRAEVVPYAPGDSHRTFSSRAEAVSIVRASWDYTYPDRSGYRRATDDGLVIVDDYSTAGNRDLFNPFRGKETRNYPYHTITKCALSVGDLGSDGYYRVTIFSTVPSSQGSSGGAFAWVGCGQDPEKAALFADSLMFLAKPDLFRPAKGAAAPILEPSVPGNTPATKGTAPEAPPSGGDSRRVPPSGQVGTIAAVNQRWEFVVVTPNSAEHGLGVEKRLVCKRGGKAVATLVVTRATPSSITARVVPADALQLVQVGDLVHDE